MLRHEAVEIRPHIATALSTSFADGSPTRVLGGGTPEARISANAALLQGYINGSRLPRG